MMKMLPLALLVLSAAVPQEPRKPNIVFIHADDLGYGDLSCTGQKKFSTPRLDRMAAEGSAGQPWLRPCVQSRHLGGAVTALAHDRCRRRQARAWVRARRDLEQ